ncbi:MAG: MFS transporter [Nitriliruptorales bacterium]|nr:MFS transporter [Nitriliruptorales bacterium]
MPTDHARRCASASSQPACHRTGAHRGGPDGAVSYAGRVPEDRVVVVERNLDRALDEAPPPRRRLEPDDLLRPGTTLSTAEAVAVFRDQVTSRTLDVAARELKAKGAGYYTISSAGHENNAVVGALLRPTDPAFLHYRSGGFMMARSRQVPGVDAVTDTLLSLLAAAGDPISHGRHKVWGSRQLWVPPQTSTIASHIPKAMGAAFAIQRAARVGMSLEIPDDSIVCCSFGDASANHATALAGINAARYSHRRGSRVPVLFVCEDNGIGISVDTPRRWIARNFRHLPHLEYVHAAGELDEVWDAAVAAVAACRNGRRPVFLHLQTVRLWGHAGSDVESGYRSAAEIAATEAQDPLVRNAQRLIALGAASPDDLRDLVAGVRDHVHSQATKLIGSPTLASRQAVMATLAPYDEPASRRDADAVPSHDERRSVHGSALPEDATVAVRRTMAAHINAALHDEMLRRPEMLLFGEDVGRKGGVYNVTSGLQRVFGAARVFDTLLDETTILGVAQGAALLGFLPVPEIQYLAYLHNALDQLRGEAASLGFFSAGQFSNPMVVRVAGLAYQKGFGGHFHNDNSVGALRDIPGLLLSVPSRGDDAAKMLRGVLAVARTTGRVAVFLEPIALYHEKDLHEPGDGGWLSDYPPPGQILLPGDIGVHHPDHGDVLIVTYGNGVRMALRAARRLRGDHGVAARVVDLRWLNPLPLDAVGRAAAGTSAVLVADECRATGGGIADAVVAGLVERGYDGRLGSVRSADSYVPLGPAAGTVLLSEADVVKGAVRILGRGDDTPD